MGVDRTTEIIHILLESKLPVTVDAIAGRLKVSNKTIRNELAKVEDYVRQNGLTLQKKPGSGISIEGSDGCKTALVQEIRNAAGFIEPFSPEDRKNYILKRLLISEGRITTKELADELYVSRVTVHKDLDDVEHWLSKFNLTLIAKTNYGLEISGEEEQWRNAVASLIASNKQQNELKELLYEDYNGRIDYKTLLKLKELLNLDYHQLEKIVTRAESKLKFRFSDEAYISFIIHIAIAMKRLESNKDISFSPSVLQNLREKDEYPVAEQIAREIQDSFQITFSESEIVYILLHILGAKMQQNQVDAINVDLDGEESNDLAAVMTKEIIKAAENALTIDLSDDKQLKNGLILHLRPTINRLKYGLTLRNPILDEIKENYPEIYGVAWMTSIVFERYLGRRVGEEEIGYIALHLGAAVERAQKPFRALVVCTSGIGTSQMLAARLHRCFREIEIKDVISVVALKESVLEDVDIIISTVPIEANLPVLNINPLLTQNDIKRIAQFLSDMPAKNTPGSDRPLCFEGIRIVEAGQEKITILEEICSRLEKKEYVRPDFFSSVVAREGTAPTAIGKGVAVPHGAPSLVNQSVVAVTILDEPVSWDGEEQVDIIFLIALATSDLRYVQTLLGNLYNEIDRDEFLAELRHINEEEKLSGKLRELCRVNQ